MPLYPAAKWAFIWHWDWFTFFIVGFVANDGYPFNNTIVGPIIRGRVMLAGPIVPKGDGVLFPAEAALIFRIASLLVQGF